MIIFQVVKPGVWLDGIADRQTSFNIENLIRNLIDVFYEANLSLNLFNEEMDSFRQKMELRTTLSHELMHSKFEQERAEDELIYGELEKEFALDGKEFNRYSNDVQTLFKLRKDIKAFDRGNIPREFSDKKKFLYAKSFLFALDSFDRFLGVLSKENGAPNSLTSIHNRINQEFPGLRGVRNSTHHLEDRSRGLGDFDRKTKKMKVLQLKPITNSAINAPLGNALILNSLFGTKYSCTMADGHLGEVDVSAESLSKVHKILSDTLSSFSWKGSPEIYPNPDFRYN